MRWSEVALGVVGGVEHVEHAHIDVADRSALRDARGRHHPAFELSGDLLAEATAVLFGR